MTPAETRFLGNFLKAAKEGLPIRSSSSLDVTCMVSHSGKMGCIVSSSEKELSVPFCLADVLLYNIYILYI